MERSASRATRVRSSNTRHDRRTLHVRPHHATCPTACLTTPCPMARRSTASSAASASGRFGASTARSSRAARTDARDRLERELASIEKHRLAGFFLVYWDILQLVNEIAQKLHGRDPNLAPDERPVGARARLVGQLHRLLPHRPLPHRPREEQPLPRSLPQRRAAFAARHRHRLPARHPRRAAAADLRPLWRTSTPPSSQPSPPTASAAPCSISARRSACRRRCWRS